MEKLEVRSENEEKRLAADRGKTLVAAFLILNSQFSILNSSVLDLTP